MESQVHILVVDRESADARAITAFLDEQGYAAHAVTDGEKAADRLDHQVFDVLVAGVRVPRVDGLRLMALARERNPHVCVVLLADEGEDVERATAAIRAGAHDFQRKPLNLAKLAGVIEHGLAYQRIALDQAALHRRLDERYGLGNIAGRSRPMVRVYNAIREAGPTAHPVLIYGEPGSGKSLIAQALHHNSPRRDAPFVTLECEGVPEVVIRAELFGYAVGRQLDASPLRWGRLVLADGGTLFVHSVEALSSALQARLLAFMEDGVVERPDTGKHTRVSVRLILAAQCPLGPLVDEGRFNAALFERLRAVTITVPPLRERREDIPLLLDHFLREAADRQNQPPPALHPEARDLLTRYDWPGNAREVESMVHALALDAFSGRTIGVRHIPEAIREAAVPAGDEIRLSTGMTMHAIERAAIEHTLRACNYDKEACARTLGIGLRTLYRKLKAYEAEDGEG
ncbi:MAG: sigma-54-dependent transcriptional regulator [Candidatus Hydrogenedentota bacterium]